jgi:A118 family predicted phage portal protein
MEKAIQDWTNLYLNKAPWLHEPDDNDPTLIASLGLPAMIASEKARTALLELESEITAPTEEVEVPNPDYPGEPKYTIDANGEQVPIPAPLPPETITEERVVGDASRAEYLESQYKKLKKQLRKQIEYGIAKGGLVIKPYIVMNKETNSDGVESELTPTVEIEFDFIQADAFYPLAFDASGRITEAAFVQSKVERNQIYRRLEYHKWENNVVTVVNKAYRSNNLRTSGEIDNVDLGEEISLSEVPEWKELKERTVVKNVTKPLFAYFKMPEANTIDTSSPLGVSGFSRAVSLIHDADLQYSRLLWEYEGGELAIDIDRDALRTDIDAGGNEHTKQNKLQQRLFRKVDLGSSSDTYQPFAPSLRDTNYIQGLNTILMRIEDVCGISRGTLSDSADVARTATELKILKQRSYQTNADIQQAIEEAVRDVIYIMNVYATLYEITPEGEYEVNFEWDDSIIVDIDEEINKRLTLMQNGLTSKLENRMWYFGETEQQAREALARVDEENQQAQESDMMMQYEFNNRRQ